ELHVAEIGRFARPRGCPRNMQSRPVLHESSPNSRSQPPIYVRAPRDVAFIRRTLDNSVCTFRFSVADGIFQPTSLGSTRPAVVGRPAAERGPFGRGRRVAAEIVDHDV